MESKADVLYAVRICKTECLLLKTNPNGEYKINRRSSRQELLYLKNSSFTFKQRRRTYIDENFLKGFLELFLKADHTNHMSWGSKRISSTIGWFNFLF